MTRLTTALLLAGTSLLAAPQAHSGALQSVARFFGSELGRATWQVFAESRDLRHASRITILEAQKRAGLRADPLMTYPELAKRLDAQSFSWVGDLRSFTSLREELTRFQRLSLTNGLRASEGGMPPQARAWLHQELRPWAREYGRMNFVPVQPPTISLRDVMAWNSEARSDWVRYRFFHGEYEEIRDLTLRILETYPPSRYAYIGVGRSPTPVMRFIQEWGEISGRKVVTSNVPYTRPPKYGEKAFEVPPETMDSHLDRFLPASDRLAGRELLVMDYTASGQGLTLFSSELARYVSARHGAPRFRVLGLSDRPPQGDFEVLSLAEYPVLRRTFLAGAYERVAQYKQYRVGWDPAEQLESRRSWELFGRAIRDRMKSDPFFSAR